MSTRLLLPLALLATLTACQESSPPAARAADAASTASTPAAGRGGDRVDCPTWFSESRATLLGALNGTEQANMIQLVTALSASTHANGETGEVRVPTSVCGYFGGQLRKDRKPNSRRAAPRAAACTAMIESIDQHCLQPLAQRGIALNAACNQTLIGFSGSAEDLDQRMANDGGCDWVSLP